MLFESLGNRLGRQTSKYSVIENTGNTHSQFVLVVTYSLPRKTL